MGVAPTSGTAVTVDPHSDARWDRYVSGHPDALVYHHSAWLKVLEREYGRRCLGLALEDGEGELRALLPLQATRGIPGIRGRVEAGRRLASLPRTPVAGPLADDSAGLAALVRAALEHLPAGMRLQLKPAAARLDGLVDGVTATPWRSTYVVALPASPEDLRFGNARNHGRIRSGVTRAGREGVVVRDAARPADVRDWYALYLETMRHHLLPPRPLRLFEAMWELLRPHGMMRLSLAERRGELLAGSILLELGSTAFYAFNGVRRSALGLRPNDVLQWHAIHDACGAGRRWYDLGEVSEGNEGLAAFKRKWGAEERQLVRYHHPPVPASGEAEPSEARALAERAWQRVPLRATAAAGDLVYRFL